MQCTGSLTVTFTLTPTVTVTLHLPVSQPLTVNLVRALALSMFTVWSGMMRGCMCACACDIQDLAYLWLSGLSVHLSRCTTVHSVICSHYCSILDYTHQTTLCLATSVP